MNLWVIPLAMFIGAVIGVAFSFGYVIWRSLDEARKSSRTDMELIQMLDTLFKEPTKRTKSKGKITAENNDMKVSIKKVKSKGESQSIN